MNEIFEAKLEAQEIGRQRCLFLRIETANLRCSREPDMPHRCLRKSRTCRRTSWFGSGRICRSPLRGFAIVEIKSTRSETSYNADGSN